MSVELPPLPDIANTEGPIWRAIDNWFRAIEGDMAGAAAREIDAAIGKEMRDYALAALAARTPMEAAAPALLEALKELLAVAPAKAPAAGLIVGIEDRHAKALTAARAAIAAARGKP